MPNNLLQITLKDVAAKAGVSFTTVSRALHGKSDINENTRKRIVEIAEELGYHPNNVARSLRMKRTNVLGVIIPDNSNPYFANLLKGVEDAAKKRKFSIVVINIQEKEQYEKEAVSTLSAMQVDGIISVPINEENYNRISLPHIFLSRCNNTNELENSNYIINDDFTGEYLATKHLIQRGFNKIYFINGPKHISLSTQRLNGYKRALEEYEIDFINKYVIYENYTMEDGYNSFGKIACIERPPFGILCFSDYVSIGVLRSAMEFNFKIPEEVGIVGYDDIDMASFMSVPLTTVRQAKFDMGSLGTDILIDLIKHKDKYKEKVQRVLQPELVIRKTT